MKKSLVQSPAVPAEYELADADAIQALVQGTADEFQQRRALKWIVEVAGGMYQFQYYPSDRDTAFALGRGFVSQQIVKLSKLNLSALRRASHD